MCSDADKIKRILEWCEIIKEVCPNKLNSEDSKILDALKRRLELEEGDYGYCKHCNRKLTWRNVGGYCGACEW